MVLLAIVQAVQLLPRPVSLPPREVLFVVLIVVVILGLYVSVSTRMP